MSAFIGVTRVWLSGAAEGSTYYVDPINGNDALAGTSATSAWKTLSKVNATSFYPGDKILLKRGGSWNERLLVTQSGSRASPLLFSSYGVGDNPLLVGSDSIDTGAATLATDQTNTYSVSLAVTPYIVWENEAYLTKQTSIALVEAAPGSWYWASGVLYIHATDSSDVSANARSYEGYKYMQNIFVSESVSDVVIDGIDCIKTYGTASGDFGSVGGIDVRGTRIKVENCTSRLHERHCVTLYLTAVDCEVSNCYFLETYTTTPVAVYGSGTHDNIIKQCEIIKGITDVGLVVHGQAKNTTISKNKFINNLSGYAGGVNAYDSGTTGITINGNLFLGDFQSSSLIRLQYNGDVDVVNNVMSNSATLNGGMITANDLTSLSVSHNTMVSAKSIFHVSIGANITSSAVYNNIFNLAKSTTVNATSQAGFTSNNNLYYGVSGSFLQWGAANYSSIATWTAATGHDANSILSDPKFVGGIRFDLQSDSPAKALGAPSIAGSDYLDISRSLSPSAGAYE